MQITISSPRCTVPDPVLKLTEEQIRKLRKYDQRLLNAEIRFDLDHGLHRVEARLKVAGEPLIVAHGTGESFRTAVDRVVDRLSRKLRRRRERQRSSRPNVDVKDPSIARGW